RYLPIPARLSFLFFFSSRRRHTRSKRDWSSDVCSSDLVTREPGGSDVAETLRALVLDPATHIDDMTETLLFAAARADHVAKTILDRKSVGKVVVSDRFVW